MAAVLVAGDRRPVQTRRPVGERQEGDHVLAGVANHLHLPHDLQLLPVGHSGDSLSLIHSQLPNIRKMLSQCHGVSPL